MRSLEDYDSRGYRFFCSKRDIDKALNTLYGLIEGIAIDRAINPREIAEIDHWLSFHQTLLKKAPFSEIATYLKVALYDGILTQEEKFDILWACEQLSPNNPLYAWETRELQKLHGVLHGVMADNQITLSEAQELSQWLDGHSFLTGIYPYDELCSLLTSVLADGRLVPEEQDMLKAFFSQFINTKVSLNLNERELQQLKTKYKTVGLCSVCPDIVIQDKVFCCTGESLKHPRREFRSRIEELGGIFGNSVTLKTDYLIVCNNGNLSWAYSCYGRKVEKAMALREARQSILIIHENDFWDHLLDLGVTL